MWNGGEEGGMKGKKKKKELAWERQLDEKTNNRRDTIAFVL